MALNFPSAPNTGDLHTVGSIIWKYNGKAWDSLYEPSAPAQVGLSNVDNTSDEDKPVSTAQQAALDALTKDDVGLDNVDNTSDINKPVSTAQQAAIDAAGGGGGSSFDQDLNTTDSPTFATLTTTDTIATDVYAVDVGATGTVTAGEVTTDTFQVASGGYAFKSGVTQIASFYPGSATIRGSIIPGIAGIYDLGTSGGRWDDLFVERVDASGTVTADSVTAGGVEIAGPHGSTLLSAKDSSGNLASTISLTNGGNSQLNLYDSSAGLDVVLNSFGGSYLFTSNLGLGTKTPGEKLDVVGNIAATGTVQKGVYTVATLPTGVAGMTCFVSDANATTRGSTAAGGGANFMPVYSDGTNWIIS